MRSLIVFLPLMALTATIAGCDRQSGPASQDKAGAADRQAAAHAPSPAAPGDKTPGAAPGAPTGTNGGSADFGASKLIRTGRGTPAPDTPFEAPDGGAVKLTDFRGRPLLVNLWATWCAPCVAEMPALDRLSALRGDRLRVVTISMDMGGKRDVAPFFAREKLQQLDPYLDKQNALMAVLKADSLPTTILYDSAGHEVWRMIGAIDWAAPAAAALIDEAR